MKKPVTIAMLLLLLTGSFMLISSSLATQKFFAATITPTPVYAEQTESYTFTIQDLGSNPSGNKLGSAIIHIPIGFEDVSLSSVSVGAWSAELYPDSLEPTEIRITAKSPANCLRPGESLELTFSATAPEVAEFYTWTTEAFTSPSWAGDLFTLNSESSQLTVQVIPPLQFEVSFAAVLDGDSIGVSVTYSIDEWTSSSQITRTTPFTVSVDRDHLIYYSYPGSVSDNSGNLVELREAIPDSPQTVTGDITVVGTYDLSFQIAGGNIQATTSSHFDLTYFGLPQIPGGVLGSYYFVEISESTTGTFEIRIHYDDTGLNLIDEQNLHLYMGDDVDFDNNGKVDGNDVSIIQTAIHDHDNSEIYDINHDGKVDKTDLKIVQEYASSGLLIPTSAGEPGQTRLPWIDITTWVDTENNIIYGETDHFSGFGVHR